MEDNARQNASNPVGIAPQSAAGTGADGQAEVVLAQGAATEAGARTSKKKPPKESTGKVVLRLVISLIVIAVGIYLILFLVAKASRYDSIAAMLNHMFGELQLMWERINR